MNRKELAMENGTNPMNLTINELREEAVKEFKQSQFHRLQELMTALDYDNYQEARTITRILLQTFR